MSTNPFQTPTVSILNPHDTMFFQGDVLHINTCTAMEAISQLQLTDAQNIRVCVYADLKKQFLDTEGIIEFCRLWRSDLHRDSFAQKIIPVVPCDYSACMVIAALGVATVELQLSHPLFEHGIMQPQIVQHILQDAHTKLIAGGIFAPEEVENLLSWGCIDVVQYQRDSL